MVLHAVDTQRHSAPNQDDDGHHSRPHHDLEGLAARLVDPQYVLPEEVERDQHGDAHRTPGGDCFAGFGRQLKVLGHQKSFNWPQARQCFKQPKDVLPGRHAADGAGEYVVEHQGRNGQLGQEAAHGLLYHPVDAAAHEQRATLDVHATHGITKEHYRQDEPGGSRADRRFDDAANVVGGARQIAEHDCGRPPIGDELEHHAVHDNHVSSAGRRAWIGGRLSGFRRCNHSLAQGVTFPSPIRKDALC